MVGDFLKKMADSGYGHPTRNETILSAVRKYYRQILEQETGGRRLYRSSGEMAETRKLKSLMNKTWFKSKRGGQNQTPKKDLPHYLKDQETQTRTQEGNTKKAELPPQEMEETEYSIEGGGVRKTQRKSRK